MTIVHYTIGIYPHRAGGLNRYATDLIREQSKEYKVAVLLPGEWRPWYPNCGISKRKENDGICCYYLMNPTPLPLLFGLKTPRNFVGRPISQKSFERFYNDLRLDVLHLHTLMGMPESALIFFKKKGVRIIYTSHDYFGICFKVNLINQDGVLCDGPSSERCAQCNAEAPSVLFMRWRNCSITLRLRDFVRWIKNMLN